MPDALPTAMDDVLGKVVFSVPLLGNMALKFNPVNIMIVLAFVLVVLTAFRFLLFHFKKTEEDEAL